jgi:hypothetical protein
MKEFAYTVLEREGKPVALDDADDIPEFEIPATAKKAAR